MAGTSNGDQNENSAICLGAGYPIGDGASTVYGKKVSAFVRGGKSVISGQQHFKVPTITPPNILGDGLRYQPRLAGGLHANVQPLILQPSQQSQNVLKRSF